MITNSTHATPQSLPPHVQLIQMIMAIVDARVLYAAAKLGLADQLATGPKSAAELSGPMAVHAPSLHRLMRTLAGLGLLAKRDAQRFSLTALGEALKTGAPGSARGTVLTFGSSWFGSGPENIVHSIQTGSAGFEKAQGMPFFDYLAQHPEEASMFSEAMVGFSSQNAQASNALSSNNLLHLASERGRFDFIGDRMSQPARGNAKIRFPDEAIECSGDFRFGGSRWQGQPGAVRFHPRRVVVRFGASWNNQKRQPVE